MCSCNINQHPAPNSTYFMFTTAHIIFTSFNNFVHYQTTPRHRRPNPTHKSGSGLTTRQRCPCGSTSRKTEKKNNRCTDSHRSIGPTGREEGWQDGTLAIRPTSWQELVCNLCNSVVYNIHVNKELQPKPGRTSTLHK